ncbi:hypothetical protein ABW21_db0209388 [Orbilia brochopaga]|nr:hypothetical protein ABW21_db0209388 [Drechslerella brochopaga]
MAAAGRFVSKLLDDATEALTRRASVPVEQSTSRSVGWFSRRRGSGIAGDPTSHLPRMAKSLTTDEEMRAKGRPKVKLGTFSGVFVPTTLNVLSILMFLRFGFILGQSGILGMMGAYLINLVTTLSISAISTNGTVRGGGAYYLISRSLGPEFGGSIGIVFYLGYVLNTGMNAVGLIDCFMNNYGAESEGGGAFPDSFWWRYLYATAVLVFCTLICLLGSGIFAKASNLLLIILLVATYSIPFSTFFMKPIYSDNKLLYSGLSWQTFTENLYPRFLKGAAGSESAHRETFQTLFGILFPATGGIFAGASMSGDLRKPSRSIPKGTLQGLLVTFITYALVILAMGASIKRRALYTDLNVIQDVNLSAMLILAGEFATCFFSALMGVIGSAKLLQALARDNIIPHFSLFGQGTASNDEPIVAIVFTFLVAQLTLLANINQIASVVTMTYLLTFLAINLACFLLKISAAPNFRPSFSYFRWWTAFIGTVISVATMFFVDALKKGGLYILAHVIVTSDFRDSLPEAKKQQQAWMKYIDFGKCKAFMQIAISPTIEWGMRNIVLSAGLGGMRPNIAILGMYNLDEYRKRRPLIELPVPDDAIKDDNDEGNETRGQLPTDSCRIEQSIPVTAWLNVLEDMLMSLQINVALAKGFKSLQMPKKGQPAKKKYIDLWPIHWKKTYKLRVIVFVEYESDVDEEYGRVKTLLENLRIPAEVVVCWLAKGDLSSYETIVNGKEAKDDCVESVIGKEEWWIELQRRRRAAGLHESETALNSQVADLLKSEQWPQSSFLQQGLIPGSKAEKFLHGVRKFVRRRKRGRSMTRIQDMSVSLGTMNMQTHQLQPHVLSESESESDTESSSSESDSSSSTESAASLNDADDYQDNDEDESDSTWRQERRGRFNRSRPPSRRASIGGGILLSPAEVARYEAQRSSLSKGTSGLQPSRSTTLPMIEPVSAPKPLEQSATDTKDAVASASATTGLLSPIAARDTKRPGLEHRISTSAFVSTTIPHAQVADQEDSGPSIMFADQEPPSKRATGYPSGQDAPLSFNDLPSIAQYLILNDLMRRHSKDTAVLFTTLPSPLAGTYKSEEASVEYISGLDVSGYTSCTFVVQWG